MSSCEIKIGGLGGQGVIMAGMVIGRAASLFDDKYATLIQSFGPEARGAACSVQLIIDSEPILYPYVVSPHCHVVLSQDALHKFEPEFHPGGLFLYDEDMITVGHLESHLRRFGIPATRFAESLGHKQVLNLIIVGFFTAVTGIISEGATRKAIEETVPPKTFSMNLKAFELGFAHGQKLVSPL